MRPPEILTTYLTHINIIHASGQATPETSYYPALATLLNTIGNDLKPRVHCVINPKNRGAGIPDGGLFTHDQLASQPLTGDWPAPNPARGVIEAKPPHDDLDTIAAGKQVARYTQNYGQVLVTNFRQFLLVSLDKTGAITPGERFSLASTEEAFWTLAAFPRTIPDLDAERFVQYLERALRHNAPLNDPKDVAWYLASYAREARARIEQTGLAGLTPIKTALEDALGLHFDTARGEHFFRSTLVQTLFYGIFSAWVLWSKTATKDAKFDWHDAMWTLHVPAIKVLYEQIATRSRLEPLNLVEVLDWAGDALNRVNRDLFFARFAEEHAVQYFYEPFLEAFDPDLRKQLGVWYTPPEVVEYMVTRVDTILREQLNRPDGLADPDVYILDPCTGTGSYPLEILRRIHHTLSRKGGDALLAADLKRAAMQRIFGFDILPAPFVVAHLQIGLLLQSLGAPLSDKTDERAAIYLTNALTGWEQGEKKVPLPAFPELQHERDVAEAIKLRRPILVVIGNPPYNGYAGVAVEEERDLSDAYRKAIAVKQPQGQGLNDLYVRFYRMAERRIVELTGEGIVCFISNYSWLDGLSFTAMRERYLDVFDHIWIDSLNGDKYKTGKLTPTGEPDPSVFSTERNREGIQVGAAIALLLRRQRHTPAETVHFRHLWGKTKRQQLLATSVQPDDRLYETITPEPDLGLPFFPIESQADYLTWPVLPDLFPVSFPGVKTSRDDVVVDIDKDRLIARMQKYFDPKVSDEQMRRIVPGAMDNVGRFDARATRDQLMKRGFLPDKIIRYAYRPFDVRWLYWEPETDLLDRKREDFFAQVFDGNLWLEARQRQPKDSFDRGLVTRFLADNLGNGLSSYFPLRLCKDTHSQTEFFAAQSDAHEGSCKLNLSRAASKYLVHLSNESPNEYQASELAPAEAAEALFFHIVTVLRTPTYQRDNAGPLRQDWPRIPLPATRDRLTTSAKLGKQIAHLQDTDTRVNGIDAGPVRLELRPVANVSSADGQPLDPSTDLAVTAGWGYSGTRGAIMPGHGRALERPYTPEEETAIAAWRNPLGLDLTDALPLLGETTFDIYLNDRAYWRNIPSRVWTYTMGGYPVLKKWLSYREQTVLGRPLTLDEARLFQSIARRIAALLLLEPRLDANYHATTADLYDWSTTAPPPTNTLALW